ncbi:hypothetical protein PJP10_31155, partial [Mycobacterium kansasii]
AVKAFTGMLLTVGYYMDDAGEKSNRPSIFSDIYEMTQNISWIQNSTQPYNQRGHTRGKTEKELSTVETFVCSKLMFICHPNRL